MGIRDKLRVYSSILKLGSAVSGCGVFFAYHISKTYQTLNKVVNTKVIDRDNKYTPEYIYIDDPSYNILLNNENDIKSEKVLIPDRFWKGLKHSITWRLLWMCQQGNQQQQNLALEQLASLKANKDWDCCQLAQALDEKTAILLAHTKGADLRYFLPPPIHIRRAAKSPNLLSFKLRLIIRAVQAHQPHCCIQQFLTRYFLNVQDHSLESDGLPTKPSTVSERELCVLCLNALHHHLSLFYNNIYELDFSSQILVESGIIQCVAEAFIRFPKDIEIDLAAVQLLSVLSIHKNLVKYFFQNGIIGHLARLISSEDVRLSSTSAICLYNLSGEYCYKPGLFILHPIYRDTKPHLCDVLLVHGLRGGVFVTWRQRDRKINESSVYEFKNYVSEDKNCQRHNKNLDISDPELKEVLEDIMELEDESLLSDMEVVLHDLPILERRETYSKKLTATKKKQALEEEDEDKCTYSFCWPKDWLPKDCKNIRILGINYWSTLSDWLDKCPLQTAEISTKAVELTPAIVAAGVGIRDVPVVWLAHSMGGLIVKQLLIHAANSTELSTKKISENTKALVFYSTPHKGSSLANMPRAASALLWTSNDVRQLQQNSPVLLDIQDSFISLADFYDWETISFAETMPTLVTAFKVPVHFVESTSADLGRGVHYELPLDHFSICKPATRQSILYSTVLDVLLKLIKEKEEYLQSKTHVGRIKSIMKRYFLFEYRNNLIKLDSVNTSAYGSYYEPYVFDVFTDGFTG